MTATIDLQGTFNTPVPCPVCKSFMRTDYDGQGLPVATCVSPTCDQTHFGDGWLRQNDYWEETGRGD